MQPKQIPTITLVLVLVAALVGGSIQAYAQACLGWIGNGSSTSCGWANNCAEFDGYTYMFCVNVFCQHSLACAPPWQYQESTCYVMGCWGSYWLDACNYCSNGQR